ncbi:MAG TPA: hypothetical protein VLM85_09830 [Polyangiaceae bacterium]|nr:hypothetical protein [Polyangiaceae bacterium]
MGCRVGVAGCAISVLLVACPAAGQANDDDSNVDRLRPRVGVSFVSGIVEVPYASLETDPTTVGVAVRVGVQVNDHFAVFDQINLTAFWLQLRDAVFFEWTPVAYFSVGVGPAIEWVADIGGSADSDWSLGGSLRLALNVPYSRGRWGRRRAVSFSVEVTPSYAFAGSNTYSTSGFQLGLLGGIGLEFY